MDDGIEPGDSISQVSKERSHASSTCHTTHSASSPGSGRSKEQLDLDISTLAIRMNSQEKRAQLKRKKLEIDLDIEQNELKEQMDLAKVEREMLYEDQGSSSSRSAVRVPEQVRRNHTSNAEINKMLDECYMFLGSGKIDGAKACRVYCPSTTRQTVKPKSIDPEKATRETQGKPQRTKAPVISKKNTQSVPRETFESNTRKDKIGYFPSPTRKDSESPDRTPDKALEALYHHQAVMMGALQAPKIELLEFHGDPMSYHSFIRSFEENVEKMLYDDGAPASSICVRERLVEPSSVVT